MSIIFYLKRRMGFSVIAEVSCMLLTCSRAF